MKKKTCFAAFSMTALLLLLLALCWQNRDVHFASLEDAETRIRDAGFVCSMDGQLPTVEANGFLVSRETVPRKEICEMPKVGPYDLAKWKGRIWIARIGNATSMGLDEKSPGYAFRVWGNVAAFGDREFLSEVESSVRTGQT